eukprot:scaffold14697_cov124-Cylindrotheca_fusiformis.AAC.11
MGGKASNCADQYYVPKLATSLLWKYAIKHKFLRDLLLCLKVGGCSSKAMSPTETAQLVFVSRTTVLALRNSA